MIQPLRCQRAGTIAVSGTNRWQLDLAQWATAYWDDYGKLSTLAERGAATAGQPRLIKDTVAGLPATAAGCRTETTVTVGT